MIKNSCAVALLSMGFAMSSAHAVEVVDKVYFDAAFPTGLGIGIGKSFNENFGVRAQFSTLKLDDQRTEEGTNYQAEYDSNFFGAYVDYFPFSGGFRLTGGVSATDSVLMLDARGSGSEVDINGNKVILNGDDFVKFEAELPSVMPYLGIGYGHNFGQGFYVAADFGFYFGSVKTRFDVSERVRAAVGDAAVESERQSLEQSAADFDILPVLGLSVGYRF